MLWIYFDASALIKRYSQESGTQLINEAFQRLSPRQMTCSLLGVLEIVSILVRKRNDGRLAQILFEQAMAEFKAEVIDSEEFLATSVDDIIVLSSLDLIAKHNLNSNDAIILRSALNLNLILQSQGDVLSLWTSDRRFIRAAQNEGLTVFDPEIETIDALKLLLGM
jgi:predicted nucleic acid-binding protein